jgi:hypothetical protein
VAATTPAPGQEIFLRQLRYQCEHAGGDWFLLSPEERRAYFARAQDWRGMDASERRSMRARLEKFGGMTESEQQALVDEKFGRSSPEQRARILEQLREASRQMRAQRATPGPPGETAAPPTPEASTPD